MFYCIIIVACIDTFQHLPINLKELHNFKSFIAYVILANVSEPKFINKSLGPSARSLMITPRFQQ